MNYKKFFSILSLVLLLSSIMLPLVVVKAQDDTLFKVTIIAPGNANMVRRQWGQIIANSLIQLGIDARVVYLGWFGVFDRVLYPPLSLRGLMWDEGGFDMQLVGHTPGTIVNPAENFYGNNETWAPYGGNYYLYNSSEANAQMDIFLTTTNLTEREAAAMEIQRIFYEDVPVSYIFYGATPMVATPELGGRGFSDTITGLGGGWLYCNAQPLPHMLTGKTSVVYASTGEIISLIVPLSNSWYDVIITRVTNEALATPAVDMSNLSTPALLTSWAVSNNDYKWTFECRTGVKWHDGADFTADDVVFSLWAVMNPETASQHVGVYQNVFGNNITFTYANNTSFSLVSGSGDRVGNITAVDADTVEVWLPDFMETGKPYGYIDPYILNYDNNIIPKHIFEKIPPADWATTPFNTGTGSIDVGGTTYYGPVGTGPYKWVDYDSVNQIVHLEKFDQYWNKTALEADGLFEVEDYYVRFIVDKTSALAALKNDEVDILDPQYTMQTDIPTIEPSWGTVYLQEATGSQEIGYQMNHTIFGTGVDTPLGQANASRAAEAARYVRTAFDYAIPRQLIIDNLLDGFGTPAATYWAPHYSYYNSSITARPYDLAKAAEYLEKAGYTVPEQPAPPEATFFIGNSLSVYGIYIDPATNGVGPEKLLELRQTTDNSTFETIGVTTTDFAGRYFFTITPNEEGTFYYWLYDTEFAAIGLYEEYNGTYIRKLTVESFSDALDPLLSPIDEQISGLQAQISNMTIVAVVALVLSLALGFYGIYLGRRRP